MVTVKDVEKGSYADKAGVLRDYVKRTQFFFVRFGIDTNIDFRGAKVGRNVRLRHRNHAFQIGLSAFELHANNAANFLLIFAV